MRTDIHPGILPGVQDWVFLISHIKKEKMRTDIHPGILPGVQDWVFLISHIMISL